MVPPAAFHCAPPDPALYSSYTSPSERARRVQMISSSSSSRLRTLLSAFALHSSTKAICQKSIACKAGAGHSKQLQEATQHSTVSDCISQQHQGQTLADDRVLHKRRWLAEAPAGHSRHYRLHGEAAATADNRPLLHARRVQMMPSSSSSRFRTLLSAEDSIKVHATGN